jgi:FkbH-like protein
VRTVFAHADAGLTRRALAHLPALWRWRVGADDAKRVADQAANAERLRLADDLDPEAYLASLGVRLRFARNPADQLDRMAEMSGKTNQFNLALARLSRTDYAGRLAGDGAAIVTVELSDRLADSGVIALLAAHRDGRRLVVDELLVSCRAMGRRLEDSIVIGALQTLPELAEVDELVFHVADGPRNQPARRWLAAWAGLGDEPAPAGALHLPAAPARAFVAPAALNLERIS